MRLALLLVSSCLLAACDLFGAARVRAVTVQSVAVEDVDLSEPWDNPLTGDRPDVYVDIRDGDGSFSIIPDYRSDTRENVAALPLTFPAQGSDPIRLGATVTLTVNDQDVVGDDVMFASGPFTFESFYADEARGDVSRVVLANEMGRVALLVRWE